MGNTSVSAIVLCLIIGLIVGGFVVYFAFPQTITKTETITKEVPVEKQVVITQTTDYKQLVADRVLSELIGDKDLRECNGVVYDPAEIEVIKLYNGFSVTENNDGDTAVSEVQIKLNYDSGKCYKILNCGINVDDELTC